MKDQGPISGPLCLWVHLIHRFPCQHHSLLPIALGPAFETLSYLASSYVLFLRSLLMLFLPLRLYSQAPPRFGILPIHQINATSPKKPPQSLQEKNSHFSAGMRDEDPCEAPLHLSVLISEICKTQPITTK